MSMTKHHRLDDVVWHDRQLGASGTLDELIADLQRSWLAVAGRTLRERIIYALRFGWDRGLRPRRLSEIRAIFNEPKMYYGYQKHLTFAVWSTFHTTYESSFRPNDLEQSWARIGRSFQLSSAEQLELLNRTVDRETYDCLMTGEFPPKEAYRKPTVDIKYLRRQLLIVLTWLERRPMPEWTAFLLRYELMVLFPEDIKRRAHHWFHPQDFGLSREEYGHLWKGFRRFVELPDCQDFDINFVWKHRTQLLQDPEILKRVRFLSRPRSNSRW